MSWQGSRPIGWYDTFSDDGSCLCTTNLIYNADFEPGRKALWAKFRAPPQSMEKLTVLAGSGKPVEGIPITQ